MWVEVRPVEGQRVCGANFPVSSEFTGNTTKVLSSLVLLILQKSAVSGMSSAVFPYFENRK